MDGQTRSSASPASFRGPSFLTLDEHKPFPLGMLCAHCDTWLGLVDAINHREIQHGNCRTCRMEAELAVALCDEAREAMRTVLGA